MLVYIACCKIIFAELTTASIEFKKFWLCPKFNFSYALALLHIPTGGAQQYCSADRAEYCCCCNGNFVLCQHSNQQC
jgi:hypothetical protein